MSGATPILQHHLPVQPWMEPALWRLPGVQPLDPAKWLEVDDAYAAQMAEKARQLALRPGAVHALPDAARPAAKELLALVLATLPSLGFVVQGHAVTRPDGMRVTVDATEPLLTLGRLVQEDFCLLQKPEDLRQSASDDGQFSRHANSGGEHVLTAALLCFPGSWTLSEKLGRPLTAIHAPVAPYDGDMARRVQRLFDAIRPGQVMWRMNALLYADPDLYQPKSETDQRPRTGERRFLRAEKQCLRRLPVSGAVVFSIHSYVVKAASLSAAALAALDAGGH